jgi:HK97 family phage major capsid protein
MSLMYVTDELLADASVLTGIAGEAFSEEIMFMTEDGIFEGDGAGKPLGILNSNCLVTVSKETGQATQTIVYENVLKMWSRCWGRSRRDAIWTINQDNEPQLYAMSQVIGTAGVPVYLPANGISGSPYGTLFGAPVVTLEYNQTVGTLGDIVLADYSQYVLADKGGVQAASSMHVAFLTDEMVFRITYRVDGEPIWNAALTPFHGSNTLSPFVALAAR